MLLPTVTLPKLMLFELILSGADPEAHSETQNKANTTNGSTARWDDRLRLRVLWMF
jgi:hypothetical protein